MALDRKMELHEENTEVMSVLHSLFGYNLGFAIESRISKITTENMEQIRKDVSKILRERSKNGVLKEDNYDMNVLQKILSDEVLSIIANDYNEYKVSVMSRREGTIFTD